MFRQPWYGAGKCTRRTSMTTSPTWSRIALNRDVFAGTMDDRRILERLVANLHLATNYRYLNSNMIPATEVAFIVRHMWEFMDRKRLDASISEVPVSDGAEGFRRRHMVNTLAIAEALMSIYPAQGNELCLLLPQALPRRLNASCEARGHLPISLIFLGIFGGRTRARTWDPLIKSHLRDQAVQR